MHIVVLGQIHIQDDPHHTVEGLTEGVYMYMYIYIYLLKEEHK